MTGVLSLQQGPFGVAASAPRPVPKPGAAKPARVADSSEARLDPANARQNLPPRPRFENPEHDQSPIVSVAPSTLLEASLIASMNALSGEAEASGPPARNNPWAPPPSGLSLRDRTV